MEIDPFISFLNLLLCLLPATANGLNAMQTVKRLTQRCINLTFMVASNRGVEVNG